MKNLLKILSFTLLPAFLHGQMKQSKPDNLFLALSSRSNDTVRMDVLWQIGNYYLPLNSDSALFYFEQALQLSRSLKLRLNEAAILSSIGNVLSQKGDYSRSLRSYLTMIDIVKDPASEKLTWHLLNNETPRLVRLRLLRWSYLDLGWLYGLTANWTSDVDRQVQSFKEAKRFAEFANDSSLIAWSDLSLGMTYSSLGKFDSMALLEEKAYPFFLRSADEKGEALSLKFMGDAYQEIGKFDLARNVLIKAIQIDIHQNDQGRLGWAYLSLAGLYKKISKPDSAIFYAERGLEAHKSIHAAEGERQTYNLIYACFSELNNKDSVLVYLKLAKKISDSLNDVSMKSVFASQDVIIDEQIRLEKLEKEKIDTRNKIRMYTLLSGIVIFVFITSLLYRNYRNGKKANNILQQQKRKIEQALIDLKSAQAKLIQSEKMASLGELTAGIAHEIQNPLNFVNNFSEVSNELIDEMNTELNKGDIEEAKVIASDIKQNLEKINHHGKRADAIVKGMLQHSRSSTGQKESTDINALCDEYLRLAYHGLRAKDKTFNAKFETDFDTSLPKINVVPQEIGRVILNFINNAFYAVNERKKLNEPGYEPEVIVSTRKEKDKVEVKVKDNGTGIPEKIKDKIFQPFFTTKPTGSGTGLGLSLAYDIVKAHGGEIKADTKEGKGSEFIIQLQTN